jgi:hypothetical protein
MKRIFSGAQPEMRLFMKITALSALCLVVGLLWKTPYKNDSLLSAPVVLVLWYFLFRIMKKSQDERKAFAELERQRDFFRNGNVQDTPPEEKIVPERINDINSFG